MARESTRARLDVTMCEDLLVKTWPPMPCHFHALGEAPPFQLKVVVIIIVAVVWRAQHGSDHSTGLRLVAIAITTYCYGPCEFLRHCRIHRHKVKTSQAKHVV